MITTPEQFKTALAALLKEEWPGYRIREESHPAVESADVALLRAVMGEPVTFCEMEFERYVSIEEMAGGESAGYAAQISAHMYTEKPRVNVTDLDHRRRDAAKREVERRLGELVTRLTSDADSLAADGSSGATVVMTDHGEIELVGLADELDAYYVPFLFTLTPY